MEFRTEQRIHFFIVGTMDSQSDDDNIGFEFIF